MTNTKISIHNRNLEERKRAISNWRITREEKADLIRFLNDLALGKVNRGKRISEGRQLKYLDMLKTPLEYFRKPSSRLTVKDVEDLELALTSNKIKSCKNQPFAMVTKADIKRLLRIYLKWKLGDGEKFRKLCGWLDTRVQRKTPDYLSEQEIEKLYKACKDAEQRYFMAVLFDSGARAEEFHNIRHEDVQLPKNDNNYVKLALKEEYSKTKGRTISLYWKYSLEAVRDYLKEREAQGIRSQEPVFAKKYDVMRQWLYRLGRKILNKSVHYHLFRHSSATYYAPKMNRQQLCYRYGWTFSSDMPDVYISRAGMENNELDDKFSGTEIEDLKLMLEKQKQEVEILKEWRAKAEPQLNQKIISDSILNELVGDQAKLAMIACAVRKLKLNGKITGKVY